MAQRQPKAPKGTDTTRNGAGIGIKTSSQQYSTADTSSQNTGNGSIAVENRTRIEQLAYELYERRGGQHGHDRQDWLEAERLAKSS